MPPTAGPTYNPNGTTPQGQQVTTGNQQLMSAATSSLNSGQSLTPQVADAAQNAYQTVNNRIIDLNQPGTRQQYLNNTNINQVQGNYDTLAQQLAQYDNAHLQPQFQGQNPGMPSDLPQNPYVTYGNVSYLTPESGNLTGPQGIYNANPAYALTAQVNQGNNIVDLLNTLSSVLGKETDMGTNKYSSDLKTAAASLSGLGDILRMNTDLTMKKAELSASKSSSSNSFLDNFATAAEKIKDDFLAGHYSTEDPQGAWGKAWGQLQSLRDMYGLTDQIPDTELDQLLGGQATNTGGKWAGQGNASSDFLQSLYLKGRPTAQQNAVPGLEATISNTKSARNDYNKAWQEKNPLGNPAFAGMLDKIPGAGNWLASTSNSAAYKYMKEVQGVLGTQVAKGIGGDVGALANKDIERAQNELADLSTNPTVGKQQMDKAVMHTTQALMRVTLNGSDAINPTTGQKVHVDTPEELEQMFNKGYTYIP